MYWGMACHSWTIATSSCASVAGCSSRAHSPTKFCPQMFYWVQIRTKRRPRKALTCCCRKNPVETLATCGRALSCWNSRNLCHERNHQGDRDCIAVRNSIQAAANNVRRRLLICAYTSPHHNPTTAPSVLLQDAALGEPFTPSSVDSLVAVGERQVKVAFVCKKNLSLLLSAPSSMVVGPG